MAGQETLIYIDEKDVINASITAKNFAKEETKNRAYYNSLGALLVKKFLASENVDVTNLYNIHNIHKILEEMDISDIMLNNIHIDVRVVFNENFIFIPKSHFNYEILPDIYLVLLMSNDKKYMKFLGFFEPKLINKNNQNADFYFIEKEKLTPATNLKEFISKFEGNTAQELETNIIERADMMMLSMVDHDITEEDKKELLKNLCKSAQLRDRFIEFENFELLAFGAQNSPDVQIPVESTPRTLDFAASATAIALQEFNNANSDPFAEKDINSGFANMDKDLPELAPEAEALTRGFESDLAEEIPEIEDFTEIEEVENTLETIDTTETTDIQEEIELESNEVEVEESQPEIEDATTEIEDFTIAEEEPLTETFEEENTTSEEDLQLNEVFDQTFNNEDSAEIPELEVAETQETVVDEIQQPELATETVNFNDFETVEINSSENTEFETETVAINELEEVDTFKPSNTEEVQTETFDINSFETVEVAQSVNHDAIQETVSIDDLSIENSEQKTNTFEEPELELQSFDNLDVEEHPTMEVKEDLKPIEDKQTEETVDLDVLLDKEEDPFSQMKQGLLTEVFNKEFSSEDIIEEATNNEDDKLKSLGVFDEIEATPTENVTTEEVVANEDSDRIILPEEVMISDEDKELDAMLGFEDFETTNEETQPEETALQPEEVEQKPEETVPEIELSNLDDFGTIESIVPETESQEITEEKEPKAEDTTETIADLDLGVNDIGKACLIGGVPYEEGEDISTGELISQIDDLLSSEENSTENAETEDSTQAEIETPGIEASEEIELEGIKIPEEIQDADDIDSPEIKSLVEKDKTAQQGDDDDKLEVLFSSTLAKDDDNKIEDEMLSEDEDEDEEYEEIEEEETSEGNKKGLIIAGVALVALLAASAGGFIWWKNNNELADLMSPNPIENDTTNLPNEDLAANVPDDSNLIADKAPAQKPANPAPATQKPAAATPAPAKPAEKVAQKPPTPAKTAQAKQPAKTAAAATSKPAITGKPIEYTSVRSLSWEVPDYLSYSDGVKRYLQVAGKSIKLTLSSDLLLATEYAYSNQIKVALLVKKDGTVENAQIVKSSGSNEINEIVLRTVKDTLKVVKPASGEIPTDNFKLGLIINI